MKRRRPDRRRVKTHQSYTVDEVARTLEVSKGTVRRWQKSGLPSIDQRKPALIHGAELRRFLNARVTPKQPCPVGFCFCVKCKAPKKPAGQMAEFLHLNQSSGNLRAICPDCGTLMHRRTSRAQLELLKADLDVTILEPIPHLKDRSTPSTNDHKQVTE